MTVAEIMEAVKELKVMELSELVKALEEEFGVSATPVAVAGAVLASVAPFNATATLTVVAPASRAVPFASFTKSKPFVNSS